jgi:hypothetical protein
LIERLSNGELALPGIAVGWGVISKGVKAGGGKQAKSRK